MKFIKVRRCRIILDLGSYCAFPVILLVAIATGRMPNLNGVINPLVPLVGYAGALE